jgi:hypothetical protein
MIFFEVEVHTATITIIYFLITILWTAHNYMTERLASVFVQLLAYFFFRGLICPLFMRIQCLLFQTFFKL